MRLQKTAVAWAWILGSLASPAWAVNDARDVDLTPQRMYEFMLSEIAAQRGQFDIAIGAMTDLAKDTRDPKIAQRATEMALYAKQYEAAVDTLDIWLKEEPDAVEAHQILASLLFTNVSADDLTKLIKDWLASRPQSVDENLAHITPAIIQMHDAKEAYGIVRNITSDYSQSPDGQYLLAATAYQAGEYSDALSAINAALDTRSDWEKAAILKGEIVGHAKADDELDYYQKYLNQYPEAQTVRLSYARVLVSLKHYQESREQFNYLLKKNPNNTDIQLAVALLTLQLKDYQSATSELNDLLHRGFSDANLIHYYLAGAEEEQQHWTQAVNQYRLVKEGEQFFISQIRIASITAKQGNVKDALAIIHELHPEDDAQAEQLLFSEEEIRRDSGDTQGAFDLLGHALQHQPENINMLYEQAILADRLNRFDVLEANLRRVMVLRPNYAQAYNALGYSLTERGMRLDEAKGLIEKALSLTPNDPFIMDSLGWVYYRLGNLSEALNLLNKAYSMDADPEIAAHLGEVLWKNNQHNEAMRLWREALKVHPDNVPLKETMQRFQ